MPKISIFSHTKSPSLLKLPAKLCWQILNSTAVFSPQRHMVTCFPGAYSCGCLQSTWWSRAYYSAHTYKTWSLKPLVGSRQHKTQNASSSLLRRGDFNVNNSCLAVPHNWLEATFWAVKELRRAFLLGSAAIATNFCLSLLTVWLPHFWLGHRSDPCLEMALSLSEWGNQISGLVRQ